MNLINTSSYENFRYSSKENREPTDVAIVDLQNTRLGRPGIELAYFFCSSTSPKQRKDHFEELLRFYYDQFCQGINFINILRAAFFVLTYSQIRL